MRHPPFGLDRSHTSGSGSRDRLTKDRILDVATGKHAINIGTSASRYRFNVAHFVEFDLPSENLRIRMMADRHEESVDVEHGRLPGFDVSELQSVHSRFF